MSDLILFDSAIFIDDLRTGRHRQRMESVSGLVRTSSVVLAELWCGARKPAEREFLRALQRNHPVLTPTAGNWLESGQLLGKISAEKGFTPDKLRDMHFDVLIALTARSNGRQAVHQQRRWRCVRGEGRRAVRIAVEESDRRADSGDSRPGGRPAARARREASVRYRGVGFQHLGKRDNLQQKT